MATVGFQQDFQVFSENSSGEFQLCADDLVLFSGNNDQLTFMRGGANTVVAYGSNQTIESGLCEANYIYDLGHNLNLEFYEETTGTTMVYGAALGGAHVTLFPGQTATETTYRSGHEWGTQVDIKTTGGVVTSVADFAFDPHVAIAPAATS
jgi:hypothetical protein